jgi:mannonate dehydratase
MRAATTSSPARVGHYRWVICALLFFATAINYVDRQVFSILAPELQQVIGWSEIEYGYIVFAFHVAYAIGLVGVGSLMDRLGTRKGFSLAISFWSLASMAHGFARYDYEPAQRAALPAEEDWDSRAYLRHVASVFEAIRNEFGPELPLLHDAHHRLTPIQAAKLGKSLEPFDLFWLEDPTPAENQEALRLIRHHTTTPIATGEVFNTVWDYQYLIKEQLFDYVRSAVTHTGGITPMKKLMDYAAQYQIKSGIHGPTDVSPVGMAAALHLDLAIHNFGIQEYMPHGALTNEVFEQSFTFNDGDLHPGEKPGLGVTVNEEAAAKYPYAPAYLPFTRLKDGTVHDW